MIALALFVPLIVAFAPDTSAGVPDVATIRARIRAATGDLPAAYRETDETLSSNGTKTVERDFVSGPSRRYTFDSGRFHSERGFDGHVFWHMNDNGQVVVDDPDPGVATREQTTTTVTPISSPVQGYLVANMGTGGRGFKEFVDGTTWHTVRREQITANGTIVTTFDDVRLDHGRTFAHHLHTDNGYSYTSTDLRVVDYAPDEVAAADVAMPKPRRSLVEFPPGVSSVDLPAKFGRNHIYVRVTIAGRGLDFVLDSGASGITIDSTVAHELGLPAFQERSAVMAGRYTTARTIVPEIRVGNLIMRDVAAQEVPQGWRTDDDVKEVGLLGFDFLDELGVTIDYENKRVTVVPGANYVPPAASDTIPLDVRLSSGQPRATMTLNGALGERWILDTGGSTSVIVFDYFARRHPEAVHEAGPADGHRHMYGIGGEIDTAPLRIDSLQLAGVNLSGFTGYRVVGQTPYAQNDDGIVGVDFLRLFTLGFDYSHSKVYLVPNTVGRATMGI
jgi:predicted aspartyl protease